MAFRDAVLPALDTVRGVGGILGLRIFTVTVRIWIWSGGAPGRGAKTETNTLLVDGLGGQNVRVRQLTRKEVIASAGLYTDRDWRVGPITPSYLATILQPAGGFSDGTWDPQPIASGTQIFYVLQSTIPGTGFPANGVLCDKVGEESTALHYYLILRQTGVPGP